MKVSILSTAAFRGGANQKNSGPTRRLLGGR